MANAWNITVSESLSVATFEVMTDVTRHTRVGMNLHHEKSDNSKTASIRVAAAEYSKVASSHKRRL